MSDPVWPWIAFIMCIAVIVYICYTIFVPGKLDAWCERPRIIKKWAKAIIGRGGFYYFLIGLCKVIIVVAFGIVSLVINGLKETIEWVREEGVDWQKTRELRKKIKAAQKKRGRNA